MADNLGFSYELDDCQEDIENHQIASGFRRNTDAIPDRAIEVTEFYKELCSQGSRNAFCTPSTSTSQQGVTGYSNMVTNECVPNDPFSVCMGPGMIPDQIKGSYVPMMNPDAMEFGDADRPYMMPDSLGPQEGMMGNVSGGSNSMMGNDSSQSKNMIGKIRGQSRNMMGGMNGPNSMMGSTNPPNSMIKNRMNIPYSSATSIGTSQSGSRMGLNIKSSQYQDYSKQLAQCPPKGMPPRSHRISDPGSMYSAPSSKYPEPECRDGHMTQAVSGLQPNNMPGLVPAQGTVVQEIILTAGASLLNPGAQPAMPGTPVQRPMVPGIKPVASKLNFKIKVGKGITITWKTNLVDGKLYVEIPDMISNESLVTLLEYAEEKLKCSHVILCLNRNRTDRADLIRTFMFLGFGVAQPGNPLVPKAKDFLFLVYAIDSCDS